MKRRKELVKFDENEERDPITMGEFTDVVKHLLNSGPPDVKSENREPTKAELEKRWKLKRR